MNKRMPSLFALCFSLLLANLSPAENAELPKLLEVEKIYSSGQHCAFTDLIRFQDRWYCVFREARAHVGGDGQIRILTSEKGEAWETAALVAEKGIDLRDPKLSVTPEGKLMLLMGGSHYEGTKLLGRRPRVCFSENGSDWSRPQPILSEGDWLWRVTWREGKSYGVSYKVAEPDWTVTLVASENGIDYETIATWKINGKPNEATLRYSGEKMLALVRREAGSQTGWIGVSDPPYNEWKWNETKLRLGGPNFLADDQGRYWAGTRFHGGEVGGEKITGPKTILARMNETSLEPVLVLPSGGDTSYPGMVIHQGQLWMSYYASHEGKSSIYLARIRLPEAKTSP